LVLAIGVAFGLERFDRRLKHPEDVIDAYGVPLLAVLPHAERPSPSRDGAAILSPELRESYRSLRTNVDFAGLNGRARTIVVSSAVPGEGKSTVVRNLALAFRETGRRVAVVECDLRRPSLARIFDLPGGPGLTEVLAGEVPLSDALVEVPIAVSGLDDLARIGELEDSVKEHQNGRAPSGITLLLAGTLPANPPAVIAAAGARRILDQVRETHDVVLIDSAPLVPVTDTLPLLQYADLAVVVARFGLTTRDSAQRLLDVISRIPDVEFAGVIANDLSQFESAGYGYAYGYGYGYGYERPTRDTAPPSTQVQHTVEP
jgi:Mrp family chromosome partitioning ATPase